MNLPVIIHSYYPDLFIMMHFLAVNERVYYKIKLNSQAKRVDYKVYNFLPLSKFNMNWIWRAQKKALDKEKVYLKVQFLTQQQKVKKQLALGQLSQRFNEDQQTIVPYEDYFSCSYRFTFSANQCKLQSNQNHQLPLKDIIANIILSNNQQTKQFYQNHTNGIEIIMMDNQSLSNSDLIGLYDEREVSLYNPKEVLEIVYVQKSFWERVKKKTKNMVKSIPSAICSLITKVFSFILVLLGLNGGMSSLIWKAIPSKMIIQWIGVVVTMFFPMLAPFIGIGKMML